MTSGFAWKISARESPNGVVELHALLEGGGSENLGDWLVYVDWGDQKPFKRGSQPHSITILKAGKDLRKDE